MLISPELAKAFNEQIGHEFGASLQYLAIAAHFYQTVAHAARQAVRSTGRRREAARDEVRQVHAGHQGRIAHSGDPCAEGHFATAEEAVQAALNWEREVTKQITALMALANKENDYLAQSFLQWFIDEQLEEVVKMERMLGVVKQSGEKNLLMVEAYLVHIEKAH